MNKVLSALKKLRWKVLMTMEKKLLPPHFCYCSSNLSFKLSLSLFFFTILVRSIFNCWTTTECCRQRNTKQCKSVFRTNKAHSILEFYTILSNYSRKFRKFTMLMLMLTLLAYSKFYEIVYFLQNTIQIPSFNSLFNINFSFCFIFVLFLFFPRSLISCSFSRVVVFFFLFERKSWRRKFH